MSVQIIGTAVQAFGVLNGTTRTMTVDATGADLLVVMVPFSFYDPQNQGTVYDLGPAVSFAGTPMAKDYAEPLVNHESFGTVAVFHLARPAAGPQELAITAPYWIGSTEVAVFALAGTAGRIGIVKAEAVEGADSATAITLPGIEPPGIGEDGLLLAVATGFYNDSGDIPAAGWTAHGVAGQGWARVAALSRSLADAAEAGPPHLVARTPGADVALLAAAIAVPPRGRPRKAIEVTAAESFYLGALDQTMRGVTFGSTPATGPEGVVIDGTGADLLLVAVGYTHADPAPALVYGGRRLRYVEGFDADLEETGRFRLAILADPPAGPNLLEAAAEDRFVGIVTLTAVAVSGVTGCIEARTAVVSTDATTRIPLEDTHIDSLLLGFVFNPWGAGAGFTASGWDRPAEAVGEHAGARLFTHRGGGRIGFDLVRDTAYSAQFILALELTAAVEGQGSGRIAAEAALPAPVTAAVAAGLTSRRLAPAGQSWNVYWESWFDIPADYDDPAAIDAMRLMRVPNGTARVFLHTAKPRCSYAGPDDRLDQTGGLPIPCTGRQLRRVLDRFRRRHPETRLILVVMQYGEEWMPEPYHPDGFGGQTEADMAALRRMVDDLGLDGVDVDYECISELPGLEHHCRTDETGHRVCYTDTELVTVIKRFRRWFPRALGYELGWAGMHVGCYGEPPFDKAKPVGGGWNGGYALALARDPEARAALDYINIMTYDAGLDYEPMVAYDAYRHWFPDTALHIGLRVGPPEWGFTPPHTDTGARRSLDDMRAYLNHVLFRQGAGAFLYGWNWDAAEPSAATYSPTARYGEAYPDAAITAATALDMFGLDGVIRLPFRPAVDRVVTVEVQAADLAATPGRPRLAAAWAALPWATLPPENGGAENGAHGNGAGASDGRVPVVVLRYTDKAFATVPDDQPASTWFDPRGAVPLVIERSMPIAPESRDRAILQVGRIDLINADGALDQLPDVYDVARRRVVVRAGHRDVAGARHRDFALLFDGVGDELTGTRNAVALTVQGMAGLLDRPLTTRLYAEHPAIEVSPDLIGKRMPLGFGRLRNVEPVAVAPALGILQLSARRIQAVHAVYDRGLPIDPSGQDVADLAALAALEVPPGHFATCLAEGLIRLGTTPPVGVVTVDFDGDAEGGFVSDTAGIVRRIMLDFASLPADRLDPAGFAAIAADCPGVIGWWQGSDGTATAGEAASEILRGINGWWGEDGTGRIGIGMIRAPAATPALVIDPTMILEAPERLEMPGSTARAAWRRRVNHTRNWRPLTASDLPPSDVETALDRSFAAETWRVASAADLGVLVGRAAAQDVEPVDSWFDTAADAEAHARRLLDLYGRPGLMISLAIPALLAEELTPAGDIRFVRPVRIGATVRVIHPRYGLAQGRDMVVIATSEQWDRGRLVLTLWAPNLQDEQVA